MSELFVHLNDRLESYSKQHKTAYAEVKEKAGSLSRELGAVQYQNKDNLTNYAHLFPENKEQIKSLGGILSDTDFPVVVAQADDPRLHGILISHGFKPLEKMFTQ